MTIINNPARRALLLGVPAVALGACAAEAPKYEDALSGLHNLPGMAAPPDAPFRAGAPVALVFGSNIERVLKQQTDADKIVKSFGPLTNTRQLADQDPQYVITQAVGVLKQRYPQIEGIDDLATAARRKFASAIVLDFTVRLGASTGHQTVVALVAIAFDARQQPVSRLDASGSATLGYPAWTAKQKEASDIAVAAFREKVDRFWS
ncbi:MAG: hypothetical protein Q8M19_27460 [Reyranella sp.]|nr:hypothetical protein [Reyranella sp.]